MKSNFLNILIILASAFMIVFCIGLYYLVYKLSCLSEYELKIYKIFKFNRDVLVEGIIQESDIDGSTMVNSFNELLKIQSMVNLPVLYKKEESECKFIVKVGINKYSFILKK